MHRGLLEMFMVAGLYVVNFLTLSTAVLLAVDTLSGEISSGVMQTLASKPIHRAQIVLGKWTAYLAMTIAYLLLMSGGIVLIVKGITGFLQPNLEGALPLMALEAAVLLTITIAGGTRFTTVTTGIVGFAFYGIGFIGGWVEQIGVLSGKDEARYIGTAISLVSPGDALWRLAAHHLVPPILPQLGLTPFASLSVPSPAMVVWAVGFVVVSLLLAVRSFNRRAL
jgi:ABC-type transport system involved in multi-copper enzyme maturation permease subunit